MVQHTGPSEAPAAIPVDFNAAFLAFMEQTVLFLSRFDTPEETRAHSASLEEKEAELLCDALDLSCLEGCQRTDWDFCLF